MILTPRELDTLVAVAVTGSYADAADVLGVKVQTVKNHMQSARDKYNVRTTIDLYHEIGWLKVPVGSLVRSELRARY